MFDAEKVAIDDNVLQSFPNRQASDSNISPQPRTYIFCILDAEDDEVVLEAGGIGSAPSFRPSEMPQGGWTLAPLTSQPQGASAEEGGETKGGKNDEMEVELQYSTRRR